MNRSQFILALADDMTGALETGAKFSAVGLRTLVSAAPAEGCRASVLVYDTETRHRSPQNAANEVKRFVSQTKPVHPRLIYKKTDSTLRGNISAEAAALAEIYPAWRIGYAPAYPALGRTVREGWLYVDGVPVGNSEFARDALNPVGSSSIATILGPEVACKIFDGATDADVGDAAAAILADETMRIAMGPAALAGLIAEQIDMPRDKPPALPEVRSCLVLNGSLHKRSATQIADACAQGGLSTDRGAAWSVVSKTHAPGIAATCAAIANARYLVEQIAVTPRDAILVFGGDTAYAVVAELGFPKLLPVREIVPGVPVTRIDAAQLGHVFPGRKRDLFLITKAGGFGEPDVVCRIRKRLDSSEQ